MRIAFFTQLYMPYVAGAEILLDRLARSLQQRGHHIVVIAPKPRFPHDPLPYPVVRTLRPFSKRSLLHHTLPPLWAAYARHRFDLVHCHGEYHPAITARTFKRMTGRPYVIRPLGGGFTMVTNNPDLQPRQQQVLQDADALIAQGRFLYNRILEFGGHKDRIVTIHNGVDPSEINIGGESPYTFPYIFYAGGLRSDKGFDTLLRSFARIEKQVPSIRLVMAGDPKESATFEKLCSELNLADDRVLFTGELSRHDLALHYQHAMLYVCPFYKSPFSNANLEALAAGLPMIVTAVDGNCEQIRDGIDGIQVPPHDEAALADAMLSVCTDDSKRAQWAQAARRRSEDFTWEHMVDQYEQLYQRILQP